jgi:hypothetical protein
MEPTKITSIKELDLAAAERAMKAIASLVDGLRFAAPEDGEGAAVRLKTIAFKLDELTAALKIETPRAASASDAPLVHDLQQRIHALEGNVRRHRDQRAVILEALGGVTWEQAVPRARELVATVQASERELADIRAELPADSGKSTALHIRQLFREHREMAEEMVKGADPVDVHVAAHSTNNPPRDSAVADPDSFPFIDIVLDGPPGPNPGRFVEVEDPRGRSIHIGQWIDRGDSWALRIPMPQSPPAAEPEKRADLEGLALAGVIEALAAVIATSALNWERYPCLAWIYGVLIGHHTDTLDDLQAAYGWNDGTVEQIETHRRVLLAARGVDVF